MMPRRRWGVAVGLGTRSLTVWFRPFDWEAAHVPSAIRWVGLGIWLTREWV